MKTGQEKIQFANREVLSWAFLKRSYIYIGHFKHLLQFDRHSTVSITEIKNRGASHSGAATAHRVLAQQHVQRLGLQDTASGPGRGAGRTASDAPS